MSEGAAMGVPGRVACQLMIVIEAAEGGAERLASAMAAAPIASVVIAPVAGRPLTAAAAAPIVAAAQRGGAAALIFEDAGLARVLRADGVHLPPSGDAEAAFGNARGILGGRAIVGADAGSSRHDAMTLGELGADYVAFGLPERGRDSPDAVAARLDMIAWWAEIFEVPCVAMDVATTADAGALAAMGADFVALPVASGLPIGDIGDKVRAVLQAMQGAATAQPGKLPVED